MKLISEQRVKVRIRNSFSGSTGSTARRSTITKATSRTRPSTASPMISGELQPQVPPSEATSTRQVATEAMRKVPR